MNAVLSGKETTAWTNTAALRAVSTTTAHAIASAVMQSSGEDGGDGALSQDRNDDLFSFD